MHKMFCTLVRFCYKLMWLQFLLDYIPCKRQTFNLTLGLTAVIKQNKGGTSTRPLKHSTFAVKQHMDTASFLCQIFSHKSIIFYLPSVRLMKKCLNREVLEPFPFSSSFGPEGAHRSSDAHRCQQAEVPLCSVRILNMALSTATQYESSLEMR